MSLHRKSDLDRITEILSYLKSQVELSNPSNLTDINIYAENFYRDLLNLIFGYDLKNINILEPNSAAIDLGDEGKNFAVQVTSTITEILSYLKSQVELSNPSNFTDINIYAENFYRDFLNLIFGYDLKNINILEPNSVAIDLGDEGKNFAVQVTSKSDLTKVRKTVAKFNGKDLHKKYGRLVVLNITKKKTHMKQLIGDETKLQLDTSKDIWDISDLIEDIGDKEVDQILNVRQFLEGQVTLKNSETVAKEIKTFQALISFLSDENHPDAGSGFIEEPDPKGKIEERFSDHTEYLKSEFKELYTEYGKVLDDVFTHEDLGQVKLRRLRLHLKTSSDKVITDCGGNAEQALDVLEEYFGKRLAADGIEFDSTAIRFFLISELIMCNVFPNKEAADV